MMYVRLCTGKISTREDEILLDNGCGGCRIYSQNIYTSICQLCTHTISELSRKKVGVGLYLDRLHFCTIFTKLLLLT